MTKLFKSVKRLNTNCCKWDISEEKIGVKKELVNSFWIADSDYETCPKVKKAIKKRASHGIYGYSVIPCEYYDVLHNWVYNQYGYNISKDNVVITNGVVNALYFIVKTFTNEDDFVLVNPPVYNPFYDVIKNNRRNIVYSPLNKINIDENLITYQIDFDDLEEKIKNSKMYILCNPHNPVGRSYSFEEIKRIVELCKKYNCILVSDEIHCDLMMPGMHHTSAGKFFDTYDQIIICTAPSKTFNIAGLGSSNIFFNNQSMRDKFMKDYEEMEIIHNMFGVEATIAAYQYGSDWVFKQNQFLASQANLVYEFVKAHNLKVCKLEATYLMWLDLSSLGLTQEELIKGLEKKHVWVNNGLIYDEKSLGFIRINIACGKAQLKKGLELIGEFIEEIKSSN